MEQCHNDVNDVNITEFSIGNGNNLQDIENVSL